MTTYKKSARFVWTEAQIDYLKSTYTDMLSIDIANHLGITLQTVYYKANQLGLKKSASFLSSRLSGRLHGGQGAKTRFVKGQQSWNKGKPTPSRGRSKETQFKPGVRCGIAAKLHKPIGFERTSKDGYLERKINDDMPLRKRWRAVHLIEWEAINGPLPANHALRFKDGNKANIALDNLELISRADLMRLNTCHRYPKEIALLVQLHGALTRKINNIERESNGQ